jgi:uncharacterized hydantoinase/oxoprolinase family protein
MLMPYEAIIDWDLGGAHAKAALINNGGRVDSGVQIACPFWQGLEHLEAGIESVMDCVGGDKDLKHVVTMTGELGSTTTDLIPFTDHREVATGFSDHQRLANQTLRYTGVVRTPLMAVADRVPFAGEWVYLMAEHFATTADIYRLTGDLPDGADLLPSADNGEESVVGSTRRLARMLGLDADATDLDGWRRVSRYLVERQVRLLEDACERIRSQTGFSASAPLLGAGVGRFLVERLCHRLGRTYVGFTSLVSCRKPLASKVAECAPAVAVASLAKAAPHCALSGLNSSVKSL